MRKFIYPILALIFVAALVWYNAQLDAQLSEQAVETTQNAEEDAPDQEREAWITVADYLPASSGEIVHHYTYSLSYNETHEQANWTAHVLKARDINSTDYKRPFFEIDDQVTTGAAHWRNYKKSGYDKGHLVPAADRKASKQSYDETFLTSNISPQKHAFNAGIWNDLEYLVRGYALEYGALYVVTGPILKEGLPSIGSEKVSVPQAFFKIIYHQDRNDRRMQAYLIPVNTSSENLDDFIVPTDRIETLTGIDFFPQLEDDLENQLEGAVDRMF